MKITEIPAEWKNSDNVIERLAFACNEQMGSNLVESASDICNYGANTGHSGFIYYSDTCAFYQANKDDIWEYATNQAESFGNANVVEMIGQFRGAKNVLSAKQFENLMAWYALEEAARYVEEYETEEIEEEND